MLDEKGRLFGKINIVDLLIVLIIIAAIAFVGIKYVLPSQDPANTPQPVTILFHADSSKNFVVDSLKEGAPVNDNNTKVIMGEVVSWTTAPYFEYSTNSKNVVTEIEKPDTSVVEILVKGMGVKGDYGVTIGNTLYGIGHTMVIYCGEAKFYVSVKEITY